MQLPGLWLILRVINYPLANKIGKFFGWLKLASCSVRVGNELGAGHPKVARFSVYVVNVTSVLISVIFSVIELFLRVQLSELFASDAEVIKAVPDLTPLLAISIFLNGIQPILSGIHLSYRVLNKPGLKPLNGINFNFRCGNWKWMARCCGLC